MYGTITLIKCANIFDTFVIFLHASIVGTDIIKAHSISMLLYFVD